MITPETIEQLGLILLDDEIIVYEWPGMSTNELKAYILPEPDSNRCKIYIKSKTHYCSSLFPYELLNNDGGIEFIKKVVEKEWAKIIKQPVP